MFRKLLLSTEYLETHNLKFPKYNEVYKEFTIGRFFNNM